MPRSGTLRTAEWHTQTSHFSVGCACTCTENFRFFSKYSFIVPCISLPDKLQGRQWIRVQRTQSRRPCQGIHQPSSDLSPADSSLHRATERRDQLCSNFSFFSMTSDFSPGEWSSGILQHLFFCSDGLRLESSGLGASMGL
jgi:hypothetical protein